MPGTANRTVPRLRAQPGSLLSLLPVRNVKDQPVGGSRREQTHTHTGARAHAHTHTQSLIKCSYTCSSAHRLTESLPLKRVLPLVGPPGSAWLSHHEGFSQAKPWGLSWDDSRLPAGSSLNQPGGTAHQNGSTTPTLHTLLPPNVEMSLCSSEWAARNMSFLKYSKYEYFNQLCRNIYIY